MDDTDLEAVLNTCVWNIGQKSSLKIKVDSTTNKIG